MDGFISFHLLKSPGKNMSSSDRFPLKPTREIRENKNTPKQMEVRVISFLMPCPSQVAPSSSELPGRIRWALWPGTALHGRLANRGRRNGNSAVYLSVLNESRKSAQMAMGQSHSQIETNRKPDMGAFSGAKTSLFTTHMLQSQKVIRMTR